MGHFMLSFWPLFWILAHACFVNCQLEKRPIYIMEPSGSRQSDIPSACNMTIYEDSSVLLSHDATYSNYLKNISCTTYIQAPKGHKVALIFDEKFDIEGYRLDPQTYKCVDSLKIYNGENVSDARFSLTPLTGICGMVLPMSVRSTDENISIKWQTKGFGNFIGFAIFIVFFHEKRCYAAKGEFVCQNGRCLKLQHRCDAINSCGGSDVSDEDEKTCLSLTSRPWENEGSKRFADFLLSPFGIVLGWSLFFLLLVALVFAGCTSLCYIMLCGSLARNKEDVINLYTLKRMISTDKSMDQQCSLTESPSKTLQTTVEIPRDKDWKACTDVETSDGKGLVKAKPTRRATDPLPPGHRPSYKISIAAPRRFTTPNFPTHQTIKESSKEPTMSSNESKLVDKQALTKNTHEQEIKALILDNKRLDAKLHDIKPNDIPTSSGILNEPKQTSTPPSSPANEKLSVEKSLAPSSSPENVKKIDNETTMENTLGQKNSSNKGSAHKLTEIKDVTNDTPKNVDPPSPKVLPDDNKKELNKTLKDLVNNPLVKKDKSHSPSPTTSNRKFSLPIMGSFKNKEHK